MPVPIGGSVPLGQRDLDAADHGLRAVEHIVRGAVVALEIVAQQSAESKGETFDAEGFKGIKDYVESSVEEQSLPYFLSGMLYDDGVIDPRDTRTVLGLALSAVHSNTVAGRRGFGVFRM